MAIEDPAWLQRASADVKAIYRYWALKCQDGRPPRRADIDPLEFPRLLPHITIVEVVPDERRYIYRLVGTKDVEVRGQDPTGKSVLEGFFGPSVEDALHCYDTVVKTRQPHYDDEPYITPDRRYSDDETLFLPLSDDGENVNRVLVFASVTPLKKR
jgi:hypothetical protein